MKKTLFLLVGISFLLLSSCVSTAQVSYDVKIDYESETPAVTLIVAPTWNGNLIFGPGFGEFLCSFKNSSDKTVRVVWAESNLNYNGNTFVPFIDGQKYIDAQTPMSPAAIPKGGMITKRVYSSAQPSYTSGTYGRWNMNPIKSKQVQLIFLIKSDSGEMEINRKL